MNLSGNLKFDKLTQDYSPILSGNQDLSGELSGELSSYLAMDPSLEAVITGKFKLLSSLFQEFKTPLQSIKGGTSTFAKLWENIFNLPEQILSIKFKAKTIKKLKKKDQKLGTDKFTHPVKHVIYKPLQIFVSALKTIFSLVFKILKMLEELIVKIGKMVWNHLKKIGELFKTLAALVDESIDLAKAEYRAHKRKREIKRAEKEAERKRQAEEAEKAKREAEIREREELALKHKQENEKKEEEVKKAEETLDKNVEEAHEKIYEQPAEEPTKEEIWVEQGFTPLERSDFDTQIEWEEWEARLELNKAEYLHKSEEEIQAKEQEFRRLQEERAKYKRDVRKRAEARWIEKRKAELGDMFNPSWDRPKDSDLWKYEEDIYAEDDALRLKQLKEKEEVHDDEKVDEVIDKINDAYDEAEEADAPAVEMPAEAPTPEQIEQIEVPEPEPPAAMDDGSGDGETYEDFEEEIPEEQPDYSDMMNEEEPEEEEWTEYDEMMYEEAMEEYYRQIEEEEAEREKKKKELEALQKAEESRTKKYWNEFKKKSDNVVSSVKENVQSMLSDITFTIVETEPMDLSDVDKAIEEIMKRAEASVMNVMKVLNGAIDSITKAAKVLVKKMNERESTLAEDEFNYEMWKFEQQMQEEGFMDDYYDGMEYEYEGMPPPEFDGMEGSMMA